MNCRHCHKTLINLVLDLGSSAPSNAYLTKEELDQPETHYPLRLYVCDACWLVQTQDFASAECFFDRNYAYFSSISQSWLAHAANYCAMITKKLGLGKDSMVVEIASNDGYLLRNFTQASIPCLGIEPTVSTAEAAERIGIPVLREFFGNAMALELKKQGKQADLIIGNNVYAHVPDINDFTSGMKALLKQGGTITLEFPHLMRLLEHGQFDTVYHEHFSYLSLGAVRRIFKTAGLRVFHVEQLATHGGSIRIYGCHTNNERADEPSVAQIAALEAKNGLEELPTYRQIQKFAESVKDNFLAFLLQSKKAGKKLGAYGAAAKGNTLLNFSGVTSAMIPYVCDAAPSKQGKFLPGSHIPIVEPSEIRELKPDLLLILPWNIIDEVISQHSYIREWGGKFVTALPELRILEPHSLKKSRTAETTAS